eukprot:gene7409-7618_t
MQDGREVPLENVIHDDGCNLPLITEKTCQQLRIPFIRKKTAHLLAIDAEGYFDLLNGIAVQLSASEPVWEVAVGPATALKCALGVGFAAQHSSQSTGQGIDETNITGGSGDQGSSNSCTGVPLVHRSEMPGPAEVSGVYTPPQVATVVVTPRLSLAQRSAAKTAAATAVKSATAGQAKPVQRGSQRVPRTSWLQAGIAAVASLFAC